MCKYICLATILKLKLSSIKLRQRYLFAILPAIVGACLYYSTEYFFLARSRLHVKSMMKNDICAIAKDIAT